MALKSRNKVSSAFNMSSMTDIVFLLLIFFVVLSTLVSPNAIPVDLPKSNSKTKEKPKVAVRIDSDLVYAVNNKVIDPLSLEGELKTVMGTLPDDQSIVLHVDQTVPTGFTVNVLDIAKRNEWRIILATDPKKDE